MHSESSFKVTDDLLLGGRVRLRQPAEGYRAAMDPVMLAASVEARSGERVLDLGCGVGAAALCLLARLPGVLVTGLEIQPVLAELARQNALSNGHGEGFRVVEGSVSGVPAGLGGFDHVMTNPPFTPSGSGTKPPGEIKATANMEGEVDLSGWIKAAAKLVKPKGQLVIIHRADRLADLLAAMTGRGLGGVRILPLWPKSGRAAVRVIVAARKGSRSALELLPGLVLHHEDGSHTEAAEAVLRHGESLTL